MSDLSLIIEVVGGPVIGWIDEAPSDPHVTDRSYVSDVEATIAKYITAIETEDSGIMCKCLWKYNPLDLLNGIPKEECRKMLDEVSPQCPVHTKEGLVLGFFQWLTRVPNE